MTKTDTVQAERKSSAKEERTSKVEALFSAFLKERHLRHTPERITVLREIYAFEKHFDADELHMRLVAKGDRVSRATVYNTLELLQSADLIKKHQFGQNQAKYEAAFSYRQHDHLICNDCNEVFEFCDPRIQGIQEMVAQVFQFTVESHSLQVYGRCNRTECPNRLH